jgi:hypothetical protein
MGPDIRPPDQGRYTLEEQDQEWSGSLVSELRLSVMESVPFRTRSLTPAGEHARLPGGACGQLPVAAVAAAALQAVPPAATVRSWPGSAPGSSPLSR